MNLTITFELSETDIKFIDNELVKFNLSIIDKVSDLSTQAINFAIKDDSGKIIAGILGSKYYMNAAHIDVLWVDETQRGNDLGTKLLSKFEETAKEKNCYLIHLDTFDFQAPKFYEKNGYQKYGVLENNPVGHKRFYYYKLLN